MTKRWATYELSRSFQIAFITSIDEPSSSYRYNIDELGTINLNSIDKQLISNRRTIDEPPMSYRYVISIYMYRGAIDQLLLSID